MILGVVLAAAMMAVPVAASAAAPPWLRQAAAAPGNGDSAAVVLLDQIDVTIDGDGRLRTTRRYAVRVTSRAGRAAASAHEVYVTSSGKVRSVRGWLIGARGDRDLDDRHIVDLASVDNDIYNEVRIRAISARDEIADGEVFGAEIESEDQMLFAQLEWPLQERWPVVVARRTLRLPAGWQARSLTFNAAPIQQRTDGPITIWEARGLRELREEPAMPPLSDLVPRLAISIFGAPPARPAGQFAGWAEVAGWLNGLSAAAGTPSDAVARKARELTAAATGDAARIAAIARFAQQVQYVSIQTGVGRGGGYQPRPPALVLERNYGDCKDKAALMQALLGAVGIKSYLVAIYSGNRNYVRSEFPSPQQFNHAIVAVSVSADTDLPAAFTHPTFGRLLAFDPTDAHTPVGELPIDQQGSLALIVSAATSDIARMPSSPVLQPLVERRLDGTLDARGVLTARLEERTRRHAAARERAAAAILNPTDYRRMIEERVRAVAPGTSLRTLSNVEEPAGAFTLVLEIASPNFAQATGRLLTVAPPFLGEHLELPAADRVYPMVLDQTFASEHVSVAMPSGYVVDEIPGAISLDTPFGRYHRTYEHAGDRLVVRRLLELKASTVPVADLAALRTFLDAVRAGDTQPLVLMRR